MLRPQPADLRARGIIVPFVGIKLIDSIISGSSLVMLRRQLPCCRHRHADHLHRAIGVLYPSSSRQSIRSPSTTRRRGSLVEVDGQAVGLLTDRPAVRAPPEYFHPRQSTAGRATTPPPARVQPGRRTPASSPAAERVHAYRVETASTTDAAVPVDAVTASASGSRSPHLGRQRHAMPAPRVARRAVSTSRRCSSWSTTTPLAATSVSSVSEPSTFSS